MSHARLRSAAMVGGISRAWEHGGRPYATRTAGVISDTAGCSKGLENAGANSTSLVQPLTGVYNVPKRTMSSSPSDRTLTEDNVYSNLRRMEYAVRGPLLLRALEIEKELQKVRFSA